MLTGYNTDVLFEEVTFHVQTEDRGDGNPVIDTLVYCGGQILHQEKHSYADIPEGDSHQRQVAQRLDRQHRDLCRRTRHGEFSAGLVERPDSAALNRSLIEALAEVIDTVTPLEMTFAATSVAPTLRGTLQVAGPGEEAVAGVRLSARFIRHGLAPVRYELGEARADGAVDIALPLPPGASDVVLFTADREGAGGRLRVSLSDAEERMDTMTPTAATSVQTH